MVKDSVNEVKLRIYRHRGWEYILCDEDHTAWISRGRVGRRRKLRVSDHVVVDGVRYTVTMIENDAFKISYKLRHICIPDSIFRVGTYSLWMFPNLRSISLGAGVERLESGLFFLDRRHTVYLNKRNPYIKIQNDCILTSDGRNLLSGLPGCAAYNIPEGVQTISRDAFRGNSKLERVKMPETLAEIENEAFAYCHNLRRVIVPEGVRFIGNFGFLCCENLEYVELPSTLRATGWKAFEGCTSLKSLVFDGPFDELEDKLADEDHIIEEVFDDIPSDCTIYAPYDHVKNFREHDFWGKFAIRIRPITEHYDCDYAGPLDAEPEGDLPDMMMQLHHAFHEFQACRKAHPSAAKYLKKRMENGLEITYHDLDQWRKDEPDSEVFVKFDALNKMRDDIDLKIMHLNRRGEYPDMEGKIWE